ncbi:M1 family metallopeptidase [Rhodocytophaga rosea]|uniref:M1 family metallopeptidase n=1 Tax=Rhodocytophaga rosea TaxID=2704465 RepID=A0A6C0GF01_9BACT|nr:M1 family metallopeptidase [Rhodocytophaga rosea]QHT66565.1 M1 family metallopeptidase [Rhodocytophaga rosea]
MIKYSFIAAFFFTLFFKIYILKAQSPSLYTPIDIQKVYKKNTRSLNGVPGPAYWQNRSDYVIKASIDPQTHILTGEENITYLNNSPDTLQQLVIRLYPDVFKKGNIRDEAVNPIDITEGVNIQKIQVNGNAIDLNASRPSVRRAGTNLFLQLSSPLPPAGKTTLDIQWSYSIPQKTHIRDGLYGASSYFIAYWFPQIAVYDDIDGWDTFNYTGTQEFYNDFGNFEVEITMPDEFIVWATGVLQNPDEILEKEYASRYKNARTSDEINKIITTDDRKKGEITLSKQAHTWKFKAEYVPDFAFATSDTYLWDATSVVVDKTTNRRTVVGAAYNPSSKDFYEVARYSRQCVEYFSSDLPGVPFPYPNLTVFNGSGGMEFPMMVNDGSYNLSGAAEVTAHEIAHTYFPFYMGINERKYAWMDEGWAQMLPNEMEFKLRPGDQRTFSPQMYNAQVLSGFAGNEMDMPLMVSSSLLTGSSYGYASYFRPGVAYSTLKEMLGDELFTKTLQEYMRRWNGKHPIPYDFFYTFNDVLKEDLNWFWKPWFFEAGYPDLAIKEVQTQSKKTKITVEKKGTIPVPLVVSITFTDGSQEVIKESIRIWQKGAREFTVEKQFGKTIKKVELGALQIPDAVADNNVYVVK